MNWSVTQHFPHSLQAAMAAAFQHALGLAITGLLGVVVWVRLIAPLFGFDDGVIRVNVWVVGAVVTAYALFLLAWNRRLMQKSKFN
jgi:hypothetical protein